MLISQPKIRIFEKVIRNDAGQAFRAWFLICEQEGRIYGKLVGIEPLRREIEGKINRNEKKENFYLPVFCQKDYSKVRVNVKSHYFNPDFSTLGVFFVSQMTRAPSGRSLS